METTEKRGFIKAEWAFPVIVGTINTIILVGGLYGSYIANTIRIQDTAAAQAQEIGGLRQELNNNLNLRKQEIESIHARQQSLADTLVSDRAAAIALNNALTLRLTTIEQDIKYIQRDLGEIRNTLHQNSMHPGNGGL